MGTSINKNDEELSLGAKVKVKVDDVDRLEVYSNTETITLLYKGYKQRNAFSMSAVVLLFQSSTLFMVMDVFFKYFGSISSCRKD